MASLIDELISVLEEETGCYQMLLELANNKKDVIINGDLPSLQEMTKQEQELAGLLLRLEKRREGSINDICLVTNKSPEEMTGLKLVELLAGQDKEQSRLRSAIESLNAVILPLKEINDINKQLLNQSTEFIDFTLNAVASSREIISDNNYQAQGISKNSNSSNSFFDAKQ